MSTAAPTDLLDEEVDRTQRILDALVQEQRALPGLIADASRGDDPNLWSRLGLRQANLNHEIVAARVDVLHAQLAMARRRAELAAANANVTQTQLRDAQQAYAEAANGKPAGTARRSGTAVTSWMHEIAGAREAVNLARIADANAEAATVAALVDIEQLEDDVEVATGSRPIAEGSFLAAPQPLTQTYVLTRASIYATGGNSRSGTSVVLQAGSVPPRWAAWRLNRHSAGGGQL